MDALAVESVVREFGPSVLLIGYMWVVQARMQQAIVCLAENVEGVDESDVRDSFRVVSQKLEAD